MRLPEPPLDHKSYRILIAEDDPNIVKLVALHLKMAGFDVRSATSGLTGWETFQNYDPHLLVSDIQMPGLTGHELTAKIRTVSSIPVLLMTAMGSDDAEMNGFKSGADDYVVKPFNPKLLVARVVANLRRVYRYDATPTTAPTKVETTPLQKTPPSGSSQAQAAREAANAIAALKPNGVIETGQRKVPEGWSECGECGYMGPQSKFTVGEGDQRTAECPNCKNRALTFGLG